jgi:hypothetical protein
MQCEKLKFESDVLVGYRASSFRVAGLDSCGIQSNWKEEVGRLRKNIGKDFGRQIVLLAQFRRYNSTKHY